MTRLPGRSHASLGIGNGPINRLNGAISPAALVMFRRLQLSTSGAQMLKGVPHVGLSASRQSAAAESGKEYDQEQTDFACFHSGVLSNQPRQVKWLNTGVR